ncbi:MAG: 16S rRNA processing protein RimM [SAR324 cluster bacterium]|nr:16S rRNA processing protein RimM [SAR324 cluster bacterium]
MKKKRFSTNYPDFTWIGTIVAPHGVQGELRISPLTDTPEYYLDAESFWIETSQGLQAHEIRRIRTHKNMWLVQFSDLESRNAVESCLRSRVFLPDKALRPLADDEVFLHELIGCRVEDMEGHLLGLLTDVFETGANDVYVVKKQEREILIPVTKDVVKSVNIDQKLILVQPLDGMFDNANDPSSGTDAF